jgi:hypothetical protein
MNHPLTQTLSLIWKLLTVLILPVIMAVYVQVMDNYYGPYSFSDLDQGKNLDKWIVLAIYLGFLLCWNRLNPYVISALKKMEY